MMPHSKAQRKRKRAVDNQQDAPSHGRPSKKARAEASKRGDDAVEHALLVHYYPKLQTLRSYVLSHLPSSSRLRRKKIAAIGTPNQSSGKAPDETELQLCRLLDATVVAAAQGQEKAKPEKAEKRWEQWMNFSQKGDESYVTLSDGLAAAACSQAEVSKSHPEPQCSSPHWLADRRLCNMVTLL